MEIMIGIIGVLLLVLINIGIARKRPNKQRKAQQEAGDDMAVSSLVLLNEKMKPLKEWVIYRKTGLVIGRFEGVAADEIDLSETDCAPLISQEHAVLNYSGGHWYIEDLDSENGTGLQRAGEQNIVWLTQQIPCLIERGDIIYIADTPLLIK